MSWIKAKVDWRSWSGIEITWVLYEQYVAALPENQLRKFYTAVNDIQALRELDNGRLQESGLDG